MKGESRFLTLDGFLHCAMDLVKQDVRAAWRGIFAAGFDIHLKRWVADDHNHDDENDCVSVF